MDTVILAAVAISPPKSPEMRASDQIVPMTKAMTNPVAGISQKTPQITDKVLLISSIRPPDVFAKRSGSGMSRIALTIFRLAARQEEMATVTKVSTTPIRYASASARGLTFRVI